MHVRMCVHVCMCVSRGRRGGQGSTAEVGKSTRDTPGPLRACTCHAISAAPRHASRSCGASLAARAASAACSKSAWEPRASPRCAAWPALAMSAELSSATVITERARGGWPAQEVQAPAVGVPTPSQWSHERGTFKKNKTHRIWRENTSGRISKITGVR